MKLYSEIINLAISTGRRRLMKSEFQKANMRPLFFPALYFQECTMQDLAEYCLPSGPWGNTRPANMAATASHARSWQRFVDTEATHCAVFEDEVFVSPELGEWLADLEWWPDDADIVKIEKWRNDSPKVLLEPPIAEHKGRRIQKLLSRHMGAAGYILTRDAATELIRSRPYRMVIDHILFNFNASSVTRTMKVYQIEPALVIQGNEPAGSTLMVPGDKLSFWEFLRQETRRGILELAFPISTYWKFITGKAKITNLSYLAVADPTN